MGTAHRYSDSELESMLQDVESDLVERKESRGGVAVDRVAGRRVWCA